MPFYSPKNLENQNLEKMKKMLVDIIILHMCTINENHMIYGSWDMACMRQTECFLILDHFLFFYPPNNAENQNFEKMKKTPGGIIISHKCTTNDNHIIYDSWYMKHDRQNFLSFWATFCPFTPLATQKIKILKKWNKHLEISSFYICAPKSMTRWCTVPEIWCMTDVVIFYFGSFFALLLP